MPELFRMQLFSCIIQVMIIEGYLPTCASWKHPMHKLYWNITSEALKVSSEFVTRGFPEVELTVCNLDWRHARNKWVAQQQSLFPPAQGRDEPKKSSNWILKIS